MTTKLKKELICTKPDIAGGKNAEVRSMAERVLDNWKHVTPKQIGVASTVISYHKAAEQISHKQLWVIQNACENLDSLKTLTIARAIA